MILTPNKAAIKTLLKHNYSVYIGITEPSELIIAGEDNIPHRIIIRNVSTTIKGPWLHSPKDTGLYDFILAIWCLTEDCWLIPAQHCDALQGMSLVNKELWKLHLQGSVSVPNVGKTELKEQMVLEMKALKEADKERLFYENLLNATGSVKGEEQ
jgi:hypothetical protein